MLLFKMLYTYYSRIIHVLRGKVLQLYKMPFNLMLQNLGFLFGLFWKKKGLWTNIEQLKTLQWYTILANKRYLALECCLFMSASIVINLSLGSFRAVLSETWTGPEGCKPCGCGSWRNGSERVSSISKFYNLPWWRGKIRLLNKHLWNKCHGFLMTFLFMYLLRLTS